MITRAVLSAAALLHFAFAFGELYPWNPPLLLARVVAKLDSSAPEPRSYLSSPEDRKLVSIIVHNAGIYNLILACGFLWSAMPNLFGATLDGRSLVNVRIFFSLGAVGAGLFGLTLSPLTVIQAALGAAGIACCIYGKVGVTDDDYQQR